MAITGLIAKELWTVLERKHPFVLGPVNKNNDIVIDQASNDYNKWTMAIPTTTTEVPTQ